MWIFVDPDPERIETCSERVLTTDPGSGIMHHAGAGYPEAIADAKRHGLNLPGTAP